MRVILVQVMPVENTMRNPGHLGGWRGLASRAVAFIVVLFTIIGLLGYLRFGSEVKGSIVLNLDESLPYVPAVLVDDALPRTQTNAPRDAVLRRWSRRCWRPPSSSPTPCSSTSSPSSSPPSSRRTSPHPASKTGLRSVCRARQWAGPLRVLVSVVMTVLINDACHLPDGCRWACARPS